MNIVEMCLRVKRDYLIEHEKINQDKNKMTNTCCIVIIVLQQKEINMKKVDLNKMTAEHKKLQIEYKDYYTNITE